jgi:hypothetical protein
MAAARNTAPGTSLRARIAEVCRVGGGLVESGLGATVGKAGAGTDVDTHTIFATSGSSMQAMSRIGPRQVYPLAIPDGEGLELPVKLLGALGFYNLHGLLVLVVPPAVAEALRE